jgi:protein-disulfide isomerase
MKMLVPAALALAAGLALSGCQKTEDAAFGQKVRTYLLAHPEVLEEAFDKLQENKRLAAIKASTGAINKHRAQLERDPRDFVANPDGKVTVVEFFDYRCPYCKAALPEINKLVAANKDIRFVLKEFPILSPTSESAARAAIAAKAQGKYWPVHEALLAEKDLDEAAIDRILRENGVDMARAKIDATSKATTTLLDDVHALARATGVTGTPAFFIGDKLVSGWIPDEIQAGIAAARKQAG